MSVFEFALFAEHFQFYVQDRDTEDGLSIYWDEISREDLFAVTDEIIGIATVRNMEVPITVEIIAKQPKDESLDDWDHAIETSLMVPSGKLLCCGPTTDEADLVIDVPPGTYGVRVYYGMLDEVDSEGFEGDDFYKVALWKTDEPPATDVLKRWKALETPREDEENEE